MRVFIRSAITLLIGLLTVLAAHAAEYRWVYTYTDEDGCKSCRFHTKVTCAAGRANETMAIKIDGTANSFKVYRCKKF